MHTFDAKSQIVDAYGNQLGKPLDGGVCRMADGRTFDSTGAFMIGELERLDQTLHMPLVEISYPRDIILREDVTPADEVSSFTVSTFGSPGGLGTGNGIGNGKSWAGKTSTQVSSVSVDIGKVVGPLQIWENEVKYTIPELQSSARMGRPIDTQKYEAMKLKHQMDIDEQVYIGDTPSATYGLVNSNNRTDSSQVTNVANVSVGASGSSSWSQKSPDEILADVNEILTSAWNKAAFAVMPDSLLLPPNQFGYISTAKVSLAGNASILSYVLENNILKTSRNKVLRIDPAKFLVGAGVGGTIGTLGTVDRMVAYTNEKERVRFPMTMLERTPLQYEGLFHKTTYWGRLGQVEIVYPETIAYRDGL